ncbi:Ankyrin repeats (3 copies) [Maioricimonas rarisocia]|uniref:Ankyrin repeats (3 copies) n=1 Tax=Maioricimonas rarisocia TaxID=2528026 RepID=A0A517ZG25_9PLAN|nr:ankyrin repeat domain-containing protein [Maioricimonas rarisocia]QDU41436.1 Ankyrin repeats (3 copies) [Maioricimonas rarisocia]
MADERPLSQTCCERHPDPETQRRVIRTLVKDGADVNETDKNGVTPLHHAVRFRSPTAVATLLELGADVNRVCRRSGSTPLHRAVTFTGAPETSGRQTERIEIVRILLDAGADPAIANQRGKTPVDYEKDPEVQQLLRTHAGR